MEHYEALRAYEGMTVNERLGTAGLFAHWDEARERHDRSAMVEMLYRVGLLWHEAEWTANQALNGDEFAQQRTRLDAMSLAELGQEYAAQFGRAADLGIGAANLKELILTDRINRLPLSQS